MFLVVWLALGAFLSCPEGLQFNEYADDPTPRMTSLLAGHDQLRPVMDEWERIWFADQPATPNPETVKHEPIVRWRRQATGSEGDPYQVTLEIQAKRIHITLVNEGSKYGPGYTYSLWGEYAVTKDGVLYGVIANTEPVLDPVHSRKLEIDHLFRARYRIDDGVLTIKEFKLLKHLDNLFIGRYQPYTKTADEPRVERATSAPAGECSMRHFCSPPDEATISRCLPPLRQSPAVEEFRQDMEIVVEFLVNEADPPCPYPLIGHAQLVRCRCKCTIFYTEVIESSYPFPFRCKRPRVEVIHLNRNYLRPCTGTDS